MDIRRWKQRKAIECKLIPAFQKIARDVPAYKKLLRENNVHPEQVKDTESFKKLVPIIDKQIFSRFEIAQLCRGGNLKQLKQTSVSSGFSGQYSYGLSNKKELRSLQNFCDTSFDFYFNISRRKTFLLNTLAMGVRIHTGLPSAEVSVRPDMALTIIEKFAPYYEQFIIVGNPYFVKELLEEGREQGIDWKTKRINLIIGEDWFPENFRDYLAHLLGTDFDRPEKGIIVSNMGICELGLSLFQESNETVRIRRLARENQALRYALFGEGEEICPILFHYHPYQIFLEEINSELVFTNLNTEAMIPLVRYASRDRGKIISYAELTEILATYNCQNYLPRLRLPLVAVMGRSGKSIDLRGISVTAEQIKAGLYSDFELAAATTGYFKMSKHDNQLKLEVQLKEKGDLTPDLKKRFSQAIAKYVNIDFELALYPYKEFPYGMGLIYEHKFKYI